MGLRNSKMQLDSKKSRSTGSRSNSTAGHHKPASSQHSHSDSDQSAGHAAPNDQQGPSGQGGLTFSGALASTGALALSPYQKSLIRNAWKRMNKKGIASNIGSQIFRCMLDKSSDTKRLFQHIAVIEGVFSFGLTPIQSYHHHSGYFIDVIDEAVNCMDDLSELIPKCNEYGLKHVRYVVYGFRPEFWDVFGEAMISAAREWEGWKKHRETLRAWTILVSFIVDRMRQGYESGLKRQGYLSNFQNPVTCQAPSVSDQNAQNQAEQHHQSAGFNGEGSTNVVQTKQPQQQTLLPHLSSEKLEKLSETTTVTLDARTDESPDGSITPVTDRGSSPC